MLATLLTLPLEIRNQIYGYLFSERKEVVFEDKGPILPSLRRRKPIFERPRAYLRAGVNGKTERPALFSTNAIARVNRQLHVEVSEFVFTADFDVVASVRNLDFDHVLSFLQALPGDRYEAFCVKYDGTASRNLILELGGPYHKKFDEAGFQLPDSSSSLTARNLLPMTDTGWPTNLERWIRGVESLVGEHGEIATACKTISDQISQDTWSRPPADLVQELYCAHERHFRGSGRLELGKIFFTLFSRFGAVAMMMDDNVRGSTYGLQIF